MTYFQQVQLSMYIVVVSFMKQKVFQLHEKYQSVSIPNIA